MASSGDDFVLKIKADIKSLQAGLRQAAKEADIAGKSMRTSLEPAMGSIEAAVSKGADAVVGKLKAVGIAAVAAGVAFAGAALKGALDYADALSKLRDKTKFSVEELQRLQYAASQVGLENEELAAGLDQFTKSLAEATSKGSNASIAFRNLGIALADDKGPRAAEAVFLDTMRAIEKIEDPSRRASFELELLGKAGLNVGLLASQGAGGLDELRNSAVGIISDDDIRRGDDFGDAISRLGSAISKGLTAAVLQSTPEVSKFVQELTKDPTSIQHTIDAVRDFGVKVVETGERIAKWTPAYQIYRGILKLTGGDADKAAASLDALAVAEATAAENRTMLDEGAAADGGSGPPTKPGKRAPETVEETKAREAAAAAAAKKAAEDRIKADKAQEDAEKSLMDVFAARHALEDEMAADAKTKLDAQASADREYAAQHEQQLADFESLFMDSQARQLTAEQDGFAQRLGMLADFSDAELEAVGGYNAAKEDLIRQHEDNVLKIRQEGLQSGLDFLGYVKDGEARTLLDSGAKAIQIAGTYSKKAFKVSQDLAIANAVVNTAAGIARAFGELPFYAALAASAVIAANGAVQIAAIKAAKYGGGGASGSIPGAANPDNTTQPSATGPQIALTLVGGNFSQDQVRGLVDSINEALADGAKLRT